jgi:hypothetical protein
VDISIEDAYLQRNAVDYTLTEKVVSFKDITGSSASFDLEGSILSYDFYSVNLPSDSGAKILVEVTSGSVVNVQLMPKDCSKRTPTNSRSVDCLSGFRCEIFTTKSNTVGLVGEYRIILSGEDVQGTITSQTGDSLCTGLSSDSAPFCSGVLSGTVLGESGSITQKDDYAEYYYYNLLGQFNALYSAPGGCGSTGVPDETEAALKKYACQTAMPACNKGLGQTPDYSVCTDIEKSSGVTFTDIGSSDLECNHNFYTGGVTWVGPGDDENPANTSPSSQTSESPNLLLALLIIPIIVIILIIVLIVYFVTKESGDAAGAGGNYNAQGPAQ